MKMILEKRFLDSVQLLTVMLALILGIGFAPVGQAEETSTMIITAERPGHCDDPSSVGSEMRADAQLAIWQTRINVSTDLGAKLNMNYQRTLRLAGTYMGKRG